MRSKKGNPRRINTIDGIPEAVLRKLRDLAPLFTRCESVEALYEDRRLQDISIGLNELCLKDTIIGYHYTRALSHEIRSRGLLICDGQARRQQLLSSYGYLFTDAQVERMQKLWNGYFNERQMQVRDGRIAFNFTLHALETGGARPLLTFFGGESIYKPLMQDAEIATVLRNIGEPLIIECELPARELVTFTQTPWGKTWLSSYHISVNTQARQYDVDAYIERSVLPANLVAIAPLANYQRSIL
jgi:hypothetical protein